MLYQRDYLHLLVKYGLEPPSQLSEAMGEGAPLRLEPDLRPVTRRTRGRERLSVSTYIARVNDNLRHSPLDAAHRSLGARFAPFGGWDMPLQYAGVLEEHRACRTNAVVFDVSHLGTVRMTGRGVVDALQWALSNDLHRIEPGRAQYTHLLDELDAHVIDDLIVWWVAAEELLVMPNASNTGPLVAALHDAVRRFGAPGDTVEDVTDAARGARDPGSERTRPLLAPVAPEAAEVARFHVRPFAWRGAECLAAGTGYTGEDGVEVQVPADRPRELWDALLDATIVPAGLGARDTLRLEAGLPLHGHELGQGITPLQAGLNWVVRFDKGDFRGRAAARSRAGPRDHAPAAGHDDRGPAAAARRRDRAARRCDHRHGHERQLLTRARARHRARLPRPGDRPRYRRGDRGPRADARGHGRRNAVRPSLAVAGAGAARRQSPVAMRTVRTRSVRKLATRSLQLDSRCTRLFERKNVVSGPSSS